MLKIEFGCGANPTKEGFKTCDIRDLPGVDIVCSALDIDQHIAADTVDEIWSRHFFEHLTFYHGKELLKKWFVILKPGGYCEMMLPNMDYHAQQWLNGARDLSVPANATDMFRAARSIFGKQREAKTEIWDIHKSGYNKDTLQLVVESCGYVQYTVLQSKKHLHVGFVKP